MLTNLRAKVLPERQRRTLEELTEDLDLRAGDSGAKLSAFWTMLSLSAVIATAGVLADSTATVIGAMIIAPLSTPIMGIALGVAKQRKNSSFLFVLTGSSLVVAVGLVFSIAVPGTFDLLDDSQIASRTSPTLVDLVSALATGFAGAVALARRDVAAVLPGVAIAISLVPPLAVVGVCLGQGAVTLAVGALLLFLSNLFALVFAGIVTFTVLGYTTDALRSGTRSHRRPYAVLTTLMVLVAVPLAANTVVTYLLSNWTADVKTEAESWLETSPGAEVTSVDFASTTVHVHVRHVAELPSFADLLRRLEKVLPDGIDIVVDTTVGRAIDVGTVGES